jgi:hypothetical protein
MWASPRRKFIPAQLAVAGAASRVPGISLPSLRYMECVDLEALVRFRVT